MSAQDIIVELQNLDVDLWVENDKLRYTAPPGVMTDAYLRQLTENKQAIIEWLQSAVRSKDTIIEPIQIVSREQPLPTSFAQERLLFIASLIPGKDPYNVALSLKLIGDLDRSALQKALNTIVERHESLRTRFINQGGQYLQLIEPSLTIPLVHFSLMDCKKSKRDERLKHMVVEERRLPFDLQTGPVLRATLIELAENEHALLVTLHHIVSDAWSLGILFSELSRLYSAYSTGTDIEFPPLKIQYADYATWQRQSLSAGSLQRQADYWRNKLDGLSTLQLPTDFIRPQIQTFEGDLVNRELPVTLTAAIKQLSDEAGATIFMTMLAAFNVLLKRYCQQDDIVIGTPIANRSRVEIEELIGFFINMLVLRTDLSGAPTFNTLLERVKETALEAYQHPDLSFEKLVEELNVERDLSRNPLFQVAFSMQNSPTGAAQLQGLKLELLKTDEATTTRFDLEINIIETQGQLVIASIYNSQLFRKNTIEKMLAQYHELLKNIVADPNKTVDSLQILSDEEYQKVVYQWNQTSTDYPRDKTVHELFERQAAAIPDAIAIEYQGGSLGYSELNAQANRLAHYLIAAGVKPDAAIVVLMERTPNLVIAQLAVLKAGAAYVAIDPDYPPQRLAFIVEDTQSPVLLTQSDLKDRVADYQGHTLCLDDDDGVLSDQSTQNPMVVVNAENLAYVIYTSGSTGEPKGVEVQHGGLMNLVSWHRHAYEVSPADRATQLAGLGFDASVWELWPYLASGASLYLVSDVSRISPADLWSWMAAQGITLSFLPTPLAEAVLREPIPDDLELRVLLTGGDRLHGGLVNKSLPFRVVNHYGPTENSVVTTCTEVDVCVTEDPPIGRPIDNVQTYILDKELQPVPVGVRGELYIGGASLARGYLNQSELTAEKFIPNPFSDEEGARLYRTGDLVRYRENGQIEFLDRIDHQVKIRGFRIELGEIESVLCRQDGVQAAVVLVQQTDQKIKRLVAYIVFDNDKSKGIDEIRYVLQEELPAYMLPSAFIVLDEIPLTSNGKFDRDALLSLEVEPIAGESYVAPHNDAELRIAKIWCDLLGIEKSGTRDNFFDLGGHSLLMSQVQARLNEEFDRKIPMLDLFQYPTIESLAGHLSSEEEKTMVPVKSRTPVDKRRRKIDVHEAVAIISMAGRFPDAPSVEHFWDNLANGVEAINFFSDDELSAAGFPEQLFKDPRYVPARGYLDDGDLFDAAFFGYPPREAELLDPQQRVFLECAWETLERAGYDPERFPGLIGVYAGSSTNSYRQNLNSHPEISGNYGIQVLIGSGKDFLPTRVSYKLNLRGPSVAIQTACSTSLVAIHEACKSLREYECDIALAGGVSILAPRAQGYVYEDEGIMSPDGHCRAFSADANGTVGGEGVGVVALKRLSEAQRDGDVIHAVIRGSAINNDGSNKVGYTAPSVEGQAEVIAMACASARVSPDSISYIETHGTGTRLGDPIEVAALERVFEESNRESGNKCALGALKASIGHLDAAAGVGGLIKTALALEHRQIPPSLNFSAPNPEIDFDAGPFFVNTELRPWETEGNRPRRAGVSSFGIGGTNAHAVLEEAPPQENSGPGREWQLIPVSAKNDVAMEQYAERIADYLERTPDAKLADVSFTLRVGRGQFDYRQAVVCHDHETAIAGLRGVAGGQSWSNSDMTNSPPVIFMFPGQGAQYVLMGQGLYESEALFRDIVDECCEQLQRHIDVDLRETLFSNPGDDATRGEAQLRQTLLAQCSLFVIEYALARLWISWGIQPTAMIGHSIGEYVAACIAGVIDLEQALLLIASRGQAMEQAPTGAMLSVPLPEQAVIAYLTDELWLSVVNGHSTCVVSGSVEAIDDLEQVLGAAGVEAIRLNTSGAFHSGLMDEVVPQLVKAAGQLKISPPRIPYISNVTGSWVGESQLRDPGYWGQHLRNTVRFADGVDVLLEKFSTGVFLEVGPGKTLSSMLRQSAADNETEVDIIASLKHPHERHVDGETVTRALAELWLSGVEIDWSSYDQPARRCRVELPTYPFQRQRYWVELATENTVSKPAARQPLPDWFYIPSWKSSQMLANCSPREMSGSWIIFANESVSCQAIIPYIEQLGGQVIKVTAGEQFAALSSSEYRINPLQKEDYGRLFAEENFCSEQTRGIIHCWGIVESDGNSLPLAKDTMQFQYYGLLYLAQALITVRNAPSLHIDVLTQHSQVVDQDDQVVPEKSMASALLKVVSQENINLKFTLYDLLDDEIEARIKQQADPEQLPVELQSIFNSSQENNENQVIAFRRNRRWIQIYERIGLNQIQSEQLPVHLREQGVYLITGGLGGVGFVLANYLASEVGARLVLSARTSLPDRAEWDHYLQEHDLSDKLKRIILQVRHLEACGAEVMISSVDVSDLTGMQKLVEEAVSRYGQINGVIHAAGVVSGNSMNSIESLSYEDCELQFIPKIYGLMNLKQLFDDYPLDFIMPVSSLSTVLGGLGFAAYSAANQFMDSLCQQQQNLGNTQWISVNWDGWLFDDIDDQGLPQTRGGMATASSLILTADEGKQVFERILNSPMLPQVVVSTGDLEARLAQWVYSLPDDTEIKSIDSSRYERPRLKTTYVEPATDTEKAICELLQELLGIERIGINDNFFELGGHSLLAINAVNRINKIFGSGLSIAKFMSLATVENLADAIQDTGQTTRIDAKPLLAKAELTHGENFPLSFAQERLWYIHALYPNVRAIYNIYSSIQLATSVEKIKAILEGLQQRHSVLRTTYSIEGTRPVQKVSQVEEIALRIIEISDFPVVENINHEVFRYCTMPFDLETGPIWRCVIVKRDDQALALTIAIHHIAADGWSINLLKQEILRLCQLDAVENELRGAEPGLQYVDYALWQREQLDASRLDILQTYWKQKLSDIPAAIDLPIDKTRPPVYSHSGALEFVALSESQSNDLRQFARENEISLYMLMLAVFKLLLSRYSQQTDIVIGTPVSGRTLTEMDDIVGLFLNTLVLRTDLSGSQTFRALLKNIRETTLEAFEYQDLPFEKIVEIVKPERDLSRSNPIYQVMFTFLVPEEIAQSGAKQKPAVLSEDIKTGEIAGSQDDLSLVVSDDESQLTIGFDYNDDLFEAATIRQMITHYRRLLKVSIASPESAIEEFEILSDEENDLVLRQWNQTQVDYAKNETLSSLFEKQVSNTPSAIAVCFEQYSLDYAGLEQKVTDVASVLVARNVEPGQLVGVYIERSIDLIVALFGILKAGAAYVPLDPEYPRERIEYMVADSGISILLSQKKFVDQLPAGVKDTIYLDDGMPGVSVEPQVFPQLTDDMLAYVIYTSGSTGKPKGVVVTHSAVVNHVFWMQDLFEFDQTDRVLQKSAISFDASVCEIFDPLLNGACVEMAAPGAHMDSEYLIRTIQEKQITTLILAPSELRMLLLSLTDPAALSSLKQMGCGGDVLTQDLKQAYYQKCNAPLYNLYGPTESTIDATSFLCTADFNRSNIPIGQPVTNTRAYILDPQSRPVPIGVHGELHIAGAQLAQGYLNQDQLTREKFVDDPFAADPHERMYKTGDRARYRHDGVIEYCGRIDNQVKLRGYRIEPGEIEIVLLGHAEVGQAAVIVREDEPGVQRLVAYLVPKNGVATEAAISLNKLVYDYLKQKLPVFMVPSHIEWMDVFPLLPNGKVDYSGFPRPSRAQKRTTISNNKPESEMETLMAKIWEDLLDIDDIETDDMFFDLGGHSLLTLKVVGRFANETNVRIPPANLISQTLRQLAASAETIAKASAKDKNDSEFGSVKKTL